MSATVATLPSARDACLLIYWLQVLDDRHVRRRFRASSLTSSTKIRPLVCTLPLKLTDGWNVIQINLIELTQRAYATHYEETTRLQVCWSWSLCLHRLIKTARPIVNCLSYSWYIFLTGRCYDRRMASAVRLSSVCRLLGLANLAIPLILS